MWNLSRLSYFSDWFVIPILGCAALMTDVWYHGITAAMLVAVMFGVVLWTFIEYTAHRWLFHRAYRREHWMHHIRPARLVGVPGWQTAILYMLVLGGCVGGLGLDFGSGLFAGLTACYLIYITMHYRFHHGPIPLPGTYWFNRMRAHDVHHMRGIEANFGVVTPAWDVLFGTYQPA